MAFVFAYRKDTGQIVRIPESHLQIFPDTFSRTPRQRAADKAARAANTTADSPAKTPEKE